MNKRVRIAIAAAAAAALVLTAAPAQATGGSAPTGTIVDVAVAASGGGTPDSNPWDYDILVQALVATGLDAALADTSKQVHGLRPERPRLPAAGEGPHRSGAGIRGGSAHDDHDRVHDGSDREHPALPRGRRQEARPGQGADRRSR